MRDRRSLFEKPRRGNPRPTLAAILILAVVLLGIRGPDAFAQSAVPGPGSAAPDSADSLFRADSVARAVSTVARDSGTTVDSARAARLVERIEAPPETAIVEATATPAPVFMGGREIFQIRSARDGLDPGERVAAIRRRINRAVADRSVPADSVRFAPSPAGIEVRLGPHFLWLITPLDADLGDPGRLAAQLAGLQQRIVEGVERERSGRTPGRLLLSVVLAVALTLAGWVLIRLVFEGGHRWRAWLARTLRGRLPAFRIRGFEVLSKSQLTGAFLAVLGRLDLAAALILLYAYLTTVFSLFPWTQGWGWMLLHFAVRQVTDVLRALWTAVPNLIAIGFILLVFRGLVGLADRLMDAVDSGVLSLPGFYPELARPTKRLARFVLWIVAIVVLYPFIPGSGSRAVQGITLLVGLMVSLGSTGIVGNMLAGLVLLYSRSFSIGDRVRVGEHTGDVVSLGFFAVKLRTPWNEEVTLPNGQVALGSIVNFTRLAADPGLVIRIEVTIGYDVPWRKVHALLLEAAGRVEGIEKEPAPWVWQRALNDFHVTYQLNATTRDSHQMLRLTSDLNAGIQDAFARAGVEILSPAFTALRDANAPALPDEPAGPRPEPGGFRIRESGDA